MTASPLIVAEPRGAYGRTPVVVDCSVLAALLFDEPTRDIAAKSLADHSLHAPWLLDVEIASVACKKARAGLTEAARLGLADYATLLLTRHGVDPRAILELATGFELSAYDAAYLQLADSLQAPLLTFDHKLGQAAKAWLGRKSGR